MSQEEVFALMAHAQDLQKQAETQLATVDKALRRLEENTVEAVAASIREDVRLSISGVKTALTDATEKLKQVSAGAVLDELTAQARTMQATVAKLSSQYGKVQLSTCGENKRPCIRVDERLGRYGDTKNGELYMVLFGY